jgi:hypothetical protein
VAAQLHSTYECVVDAIADAGYPVATNEKKLFVRGQIREEASPGSTMLNGSNVGGSAYGQKREKADEDTPYTVDGVSAGVKVDESSGRVIVVAGGYTGAARTRKSGYVAQPASARGNLAVSHAQACAE